MLILKKQLGIPVIQEWLVSLYQATDGGKTMIPTTQLKNMVSSLLGYADRKPLFLCVSGSHIWGLERPDSDYDVRGIYLDPTERFLGLGTMHGHGADTVEFSELLDGVKVDVQCYEAKKFFNMLLSGNGNCIVQLLSPICLLDTLGAEALAAPFITKDLFRYYYGYAEAQRKRALSQRGGKALVYTYREIFGGCHLLLEGRLEYDFMRLWEWAKNKGIYSTGLLDRYFPDPHQEVIDEGWRQFYAEWAMLQDKLKECRDASKLPDNPSIGAKVELHKRLLALRLADFPKLHREFTITKDNG